MAKETLFMSFGTQKGGVGKSAFTAITASYLHYVKGYNVAIIDCDYPQYSIYKLRDREAELLRKNKTLMYLLYQQIQETKRKAYPIKYSEAEYALDTAYQIIEESEEHIDIIFFDITGSMNAKGVLKLITDMDYIFIPMSADRNVLVSTLEYATVINDDFISTGKTRNKGFYLFWNQVDGRERTDLYKAYENAIAELDLSTLKTFIPNSVKFRKEIAIDNNKVLRSTIFPPYHEFIKPYHIDQLIDEVCKIAKLG